MIPAQSEVSLPRFLVQSTGSAELEVASRIGAKEGAERRADEVPHLGAEVESCFVVIIVEGSTTLQHVLSMFTAFVVRAGANKSEGENTTKRWAQFISHRSCPSSDDRSL